MNVRLQDRENGQTMNDSEIPDDATVLALLLDLGTTDGDLWRPDELAAVYRHQLAAPIEFFEADPGMRPAAEIASLCQSVTPPIVTFGDLLAHPQPPLELLRMAKDYAKVCRARTVGPIPAEIATILYVLSIVVARIARGERISELNDQSLRQLIAWASEQAWIDVGTRDLLRRAQSVLRPESLSDG